MKIRTVAALVGMILLAGCAHAPLENGKWVQADPYRGGQQTDLDRDKAACSAEVRRATQSDGMFEMCMHLKNWRESP